MGLERKVLAQAIHLSADANLLRKHEQKIRRRKKQSLPFPCAWRQHGAAPAMDATAGDVAKYVKEICRLTIAMISHNS